MGNMDERLEVLVGLVLGTIIVWAFDPIISALLSQDATVAAGSPSQGIFQVFSTIFGLHIELVIAWISFIAWVIHDS